VGRTKKAVVVTGAARGIGLATATLLAEAGVSVVMVDRDAMRLDASVDALRIGGASAVGRSLDVTNAAAIGLMMEDLQQEMVVKGLVNAAGVLQLGKITDLTEADWDRVLTVNLKSVFLMCREVVPILERNLGGSIVNIASISGRTKSILSAPNYVASKAGVIGLTMALAAQHGRAGIRVNCVAPGMIDTPMLSGYSSDDRNQITEAIPIGRFGEACEVAAVIAHLLSPEASYITGQTINVNGGQFMM
jgi:NAD(P)-dependent dehydrogenase (short-subunit alcohol dehydrogenase family)